VSSQSDFPSDLPRDPPSDTALADDILDILARETGVDRARLVSGVSIPDLDIASLDMVQALFALETHFGTDIPVIAERGGAEFATVDDLVQHVIVAIRARKAD
jgi:acyl carrier protein